MDKHVWFSFFNWLGYDHTLSLDPASFNLDLRVILTLQVKLQGHTVTTDVVSRCAWLLLVSSVTSHDLLLLNPQPVRCTDRNIWKVTEIKRARATCRVREIQEPAAMYRSTD